MYTDPPRPTLELPEPRYTAPLKPDFAAPEPKYREPLLPKLVVPVLITIKPLTPSTPEFAVVNNIEPLVEEEPYPLLTVTIPPSDDEEVPADSSNCPPDPLFPDPTAM